MRTGGIHRWSLGFGVLDFLAVVAVCFVGAMLLLPTVGSRCKPRSSRIQCISNLKQAALGLRMWANDHQGQFPFVTPVAKGGTLEFVETGEVFRHFLAASNELVSPRILACPVDEKARRPTFWANFSNANLSYFIGLDAREESPQSILAGDRNISGGVMTRGSIMVFSNDVTADFTTEMHNKQGNIVLADGSATQATTHMLRRQIKAGGLPVRLAIPRAAEQKSGSSWRSSLQIIALWALIALSGVAATFFYITMTRRLVMRAASG